MTPTIPSDSAQPRTRVNHQTGGRKKEDHTMKSNFKTLSLAILATFAVATSAHAFGDSTINGGTGGTATGGIATATGGVATGGSVTGSGNSVATGGSVTGSGNSANTNTLGQTQSNVATGGAAGNSSATGGSANNSNSVSNSVSIAAQERNPVSTATAPGLTSANGSCMGSSSLGAQGVGFGLSVGGTWTDGDCDRRYDSIRLQELGFIKAATMTMCDKPSVAAAMKNAGTPCPQVEAEKVAAVAAPKASPQAIAKGYTGNDPIVMKRLGITK